MALPEIPDWMEWKVQQGDWPRLTVRLCMRNPYRMISQKVVDLTVIHDEQSLITAVELAAQDVHDEWTHKKMIDDVVRREWATAE